MNAPLDPLVADVMRLCEMPAGGRKRTAYRGRLARRYTHDQLVQTLRMLCRKLMVDATSIDQARLTSGGAAVFKQHEAVTGLAGELLLLEERYKETSAAERLAKEGRNDARTLMLRHITVGETYQFGAALIKTTQRTSSEIIDVRKATDAGVLMVSPELRPFVTGGTPWTDWDVKRVGEEAA